MQAFAQEGEKYAMVNDDELGKLFKDVFYRRPITKDSVKTFDDRWITIGKTEEEGGKGRHVLISNSGTIKGGDLPASTHGKSLGKAERSLERADRSKHPTSTKPVAPTSKPMTKPAIPTKPVAPVTRPTTRPVTPTSKPMPTKPMTKPMPTKPVAPVLPKRPTATKKPTAAPKRPVYPYEDYMDAKTDKYGDRVYNALKGGDAEKAKRAANQAFEAHYKAYKHWEHMLANETKRHNAEMPEVKQAEYNMNKHKAEMHHYDKVSHETQALVDFYKEEKKKGK